MSLLSQIFRRDPPPEPPAEPEPAPAPAPAHPLEPVLARQVLEAHLRERHQAMEADPSRLDDVDPGILPLLIRAMGAAAHADGAVSPWEQVRLERALAQIGDAEGREALRGELVDPPCLESLVRQIPGPDTAVRFYAVSVRTVRRGVVTNSAYLAYLAQRLEIAPDVVVRLNRRFDVPLFLR